MRRSTPYRLGLIGGGPGSFIGAVHRMAAELDHAMVLVAGAFSSDAARSRDAGRAYGIDVDRAYPDVATMIAEEGKREDGIEVVALATPNHLHCAAAIAAIEAGLAVVSDKPATATLAEARRIADAVKANDGRYCLTYTYTGYAMVREARSRVAAGELGRIRKVIVEYYQGWLAAPLEQTGNKQAAWRTDPARSGVGGCIGDIGIHAFNLAEFITGDRVSALMADLDTVGVQRSLDDDCNVLLRFAGGARGFLGASQIATGEHNNLRIRVFGDQAALEWSHERADRLRLTRLDGSATEILQGTSAAGPNAAAVTRLPSGHPEGFIEAFANIYGDFARDMGGQSSDLLPRIEDGIRSMAFIETAVRASRDGAAWVRLAT